MLGSFIESEKGVVNRAVVSASYDISFTSGVNPDLAFSWLCEYPEANFDDYADDASIRSALKEKSSIISYVNLDGIPVGLVTFAITSPRSGMFQGICFTKAVHGKGVAYHALRQFIDGKFAEGIEKISAMYFSHNFKIDRLFKKLGAGQEGYLRKQTLQGGQLVDMVVVALFKEDV